MNDVCPHCGIDHLTNFTEVITREECVRALKEYHGRYQRNLKLFVMDNLEELTNQIGGVIGYELHLLIKETEQLLREIER